MQIRRRDGQVFVLKPEKAGGSPLDVEGVDLDITTDEIIQFVRDGHRRAEPPHGSPDWWALSAGET